LRVDGAIDMTTLLESTNFDIIKNDENAYLVEIISQRFDLRNSVPVTERCTELLEKEQVTKLAINLENVTYMTTSGIGALLSIYHSCDKKDIDFVIFNLNPDIRDLLNTTMVLNIINHLP
jgi:anti-anti-sigma factor